MPCISTQTLSTSWIPPQDWWDYSAVLLPQRKSFDHSEIRGITPGICTSPPFICLDLVPVVLFPIPNIHTSVSYFIPLKNCQPQLANAMI